ncbi:MAG: hypothetical protein ACI4XN_12575 [Candidatus Kurthia intestinigallinarum]
MNGEFDPLYSSNTVYRDLNQERCLTNDLEDIESDISELETSKANASHSHSQYAQIDHTHTGYATTQDVSQLQTQVNNKVDIVAGKGLSSNDYTSVEKDKLSGVESGAQKNTITGVKGNAESTYRTGNVNLTPDNIGAAASSHSHAASNITSGTFSSDRIPTVPISKGGTGATTVSGALTNLGNIGQVYSTTPNSKSVAKTTLTTIASLTLQSGTYVIVGNHQWDISGTGHMYVSRLTKSDDSVVYCVVRSDMIGGGGAIAAAIVVLTTPTTIKYETYHQYTTTANAEAIRLYAVKIK